MADEDRITFTSGFTRPFFFGTVFKFSFWTLIYQLILYWIFQKVNSNTDPEDYIMILFLPLILFSAALFVTSFPRLIRSFNWYTLLLAIYTGINLWISLYYYFTSDCSNCAEVN